MKMSSFRRCVFDEIVDDEENKISIVYSGQIGCIVANLDNLINLDYLHVKETGEEIGYYNFTSLIDANRDNYVFSCITSSELIEINALDYLRLLNLGFKGFEFV